MKIAKVDVSGGEIGGNRESVREERNRRKNIQNFSVARVANLRAVNETDEEKKRVRVVLINTYFSK